MADLRIAIRATGAREATQKMARAKKEARGLAGANRDLQQAQDRNTKSTKGGIITTHKFNEEQIRMRRGLTASSGRLKVLGRDINKYITIPFLAFAGASAKFASDLNRAMGNVQALIPDTGDRIHELTSDIRTLAAESGRAFKDLSDGLYRTISVFEDDAETIERLNVAVSMGIAGYASTAESVQLLSSVTRAFGDTSAYAVQKVADLAFQTVRYGDTTIPQLASAMQIATDRADRLAVSQEELFAVFGTLTGITGDASMVATQFRSAMDSLLRPTDALTDLLTSYGFESAEAAIASRGLAGTLTLVAREAERTGRPLQDFITRKEGITMVSRIAGNQLGRFNDRLKDNTDRVGAADDSYKAVTEGVARWTFRLDQNTRAMQANFSQIGDKVLPVLAVLVGVVADLVGAFALLPTSIQITIAAALTLISIFGIMAQLLGAIRGMKLSLMFVKWGKSMKAAGVIAASTVATLKMMLGVIGLISIAVTAVAVAWVNHERSKAEAVERTNNTLTEQLQLQRDMAREAPRLRRLEMQTGAAAFAEQYRDIGLAPDFQMTTTSVDTGSMIGAVNIQTLEKTEDAIDLNNSSLEELQSNYERLSNLMSTYSNKSAVTERDIIRLSEEFDDLSATIVDADESYGALVSDFLKITALDGTGDALERFNDEATTTAQRIDILKGGFRDMEELASLWGRPFNAENVPFSAEIQELIELLERQRDLENEISRMQSGEILSSEAQQSYTELLAVLNSVEAQIIQLGGTVPGGGSGGSGVRRWEDWFEEITGVNLLDRDGWEDIEQTGKEAGKALSESFAEELEFERVLAEALGVDFMASEVMQGHIEDIPKFINQMINEIDEDQIDSKFKWTDNIIQAMIKLSDTIEDTKALAQVNEMSKAWDNEADSIDRVNMLIEKHGVDMELVSLTRQDFMDRVEEGTGLFEAFAGQIDDDSEVFGKLAALIKMAQIEMAKFLRTYEELEGIFGDVTGSPDFGWISKFVYEFGTGGFTHAVEGLKDISHEFLIAEAALYTFAHVVENLVKVAVDAMGDAMYDLGRAMHDATDQNYRFADSMLSVLSAIVNAIPDLLINAGINVIAAAPASPAAWAFGGGLIAAGMGGKLGAGYADSVIDAERERNSTTTNVAAKGAILHSPTRLGNTLAGEAGAEAVMPLTRTRSGDLGVHVESRGSGGGEVNVNIHNYAGVEVEQSVDENTGDIDLIIKRAVQNAIGSGAVDKQMRRYNVKPRGM